MLKNSSCGPETVINGSYPCSEYSGWENIVDAIGLLNLSTMDPLVLPRSLSTVVANDVSKLSMISTSGGSYLPKFYLLCSGITNFGDRFIPDSAILVLSWGFKYFYGLGVT